MTHDELALITARMNNLEAAMTQLQTDLSDLGAFVRGRETVGAPGLVRTIEVQAAKIDRLSVDVAKLSDSHAELQRSIKADRDALANRIEGLRYGLMIGWAAGGAGLTTLAGALLKAVGWL